MSSDTNLWSGSNASLTRLRGAYLDTLHIRLRQLKDFLAVMKTEALSDAQHKELHMIAHKLAGTGSTYGFPEISQTGRALDLLMKDGVTQASVIQPLLLALATACVKILLSAEEPSPAGKDTFVPEPPISSAEPKQPPVKVDGKPHTLLIADDDENVHNIINMLFRDKARVLNALNGDEAMEQIVKNRPDLVLLDNMMPGMTGLSLLEQIQNSEYAFTPVIMLTSSAGSDQMIRGLAAGAVDYIIKPFNPVTLAQKVEQRLEQIASTVLIADDDETVRDLLAYRFRAAGYRVVCAEDGKSAWDILRITPPALAILDRMMPGYDGMTLARMMKNSPNLETVPVVFLTARHFSEDAIEGLEVGAVEYIAKPFNPEEVLARCLRHLKAKKQKVA